MFTVQFSTRAVFLDIQKVKVNHETFRDIRSAQREGAIGAAVGESRTVPRYFSCCQSRTFPMYISFWQLHSHLYLEKSRVIWDSVVSLPARHGESRNIPRYMHRAKGGGLHVVDHEMFRDIRSE